MSSPHSRSLLLCDLTQSYSPNGGGGVSTYLREKRNYILQETNHRLLQIVPGPQDRIVESGRSIWAEIAARRVKGSPNYRFITNTSKIHRVLQQFRPDLIESLCPWVLPWTAINYRRANPQTILVAGYHTDFPNVHIERVGTSLFGSAIGRGFRSLSVDYARLTYQQFDRIYALGEDMRATLRGYGIDHVDVIDLGVDSDLFHPRLRKPELRSELALESHGPLLVYAGRIDNEKRADRLLEMFRLLPEAFGASLLMLGDGKLHQQLQEQSKGLRVALPGFIGERKHLAVALASSDIYISAMADETFGISVIEAQSCGLPVVGVQAGAMPERVLPGTGLLGPVDDLSAMARNVQTIWRSGAQRMGAQARVMVEGRYSWKNTFDALLGDVYPKAQHAALMRARGKGGFGLPFRSPREAMRRRS